MDNLFDTTIYIDLFREYMDLFRDNSENRIVLWFTKDEKCEGLHECEVVQDMKKTGIALCGMTKDMKKGKSS